MPNIIISEANAKKLLAGKKVALGRYDAGEFMGFGCHGRATPQMKIGAQWLANYDVSITLPMDGVRERLSVRIDLPLPYAKPDHCVRFDISYKGAHA